MSSDKQSPDDSAQGDQPWGRVAEDGTVYVRTADGERPVGSYEAGTAEEALEFFTKRYEELEGKVHRLAQRRQPAARAAGDVEGAAPARPRHRRRPVAPVLHRAHDLHAAPQGALRRGARAPRLR